MHMPVLTVPESFHVDTSQSKEDNNVPLTMALTDNFGKEFGTKLEPQPEMPLTILIGMDGF